MTSAAAATSPSPWCTRNSSKRYGTSACSCPSSRFRARTPRLERSRMAGSKTAAAPPAKSTILIVEDDLGIAELEKSRLEEVGHRILLAHTAEEAIRTLRSTSVDLILLDYRLPGGVDGLQFFEQ